MESVSSDLLELEGILGLYNWVQNYDYSKVPTKRSLFLEVKSRLHLKIVSKNNASTPMSTGALRPENSKRSIKKGENSSEKRCLPQKAQENKGGVVGSGLFDTSIERRSRPSTLCSIYPISAFSRIHKTILDASYKNSRIYDYSSSSDGDESCEEYKSYMAWYNSSGRLQGIRGKELEGERGKKAADNCDKSVEISAEHDESDNGKYDREMDVSSLNDLIVYLRNIIRLRSAVGQSVDISGDYLRRGKNFCFLTLWKRVEELTQKKVGDLNEEISVWQQLRDVLLLTGMSLKYPTWSGEQLTIIMTSIIPKKLLNAIVEKDGDKVLNKGDKSYILNRGGGLSEIYFKFIENSKTIFDLLTVSQLIQESLSRHLDFIKSLNCDKDITGSRLGDDQLSSEEEDFLEAISEHSECGDCGLDEDGYVSVLETERNEFPGSDKAVESKLIDSLGLFVNLSEVRRPLMDGFSSSKVSSDVTFYDRANMENSNTTIITSTTTTANTKNERSSETKQSSSSDNANDHIAEFEFDINNSLQKMGESVINLGISRKLLQDLINEVLIRGTSSSFTSSSSILIEKEALVNACRFVDDCVYHSNSILEQCHKSKVYRGKHSSKKTILWTFASVIIIAFILLVGKHSNHPAVSQLIEGALSTFSDHQLSFGGVVSSNRSLSSANSSAFHDGDDSHCEAHKNYIKASDCILSKNTTQTGVNSDLCSVIGDVTVIEKCFTNIKISY